MNEASAGNGDAAKPPFKALSFSFNDLAHGRMAVRMKYLEEGERAEGGDAGGFAGCEYRLHVEQGPAERTTTDFTRGAGLSQARDLTEKLLDAGVFSWEESYGDDPAAGMSRWTLRIVFEPGVFEVRSKGGSAYPHGFDAMMEAFYGLGLPRPDAGGAKAGGPFPGAAAGAGPASPFNAQSMEGLMNAFGSMGGGFGDFDLGDLQQAMADMQANPQRMQGLLRDEFRSLPADQQDSLLDLLSSTGFATREWWERFLRG